MFTHARPHRVRPGEQLETHSTTLELLTPHDVAQTSSAAQMPFDAPHAVGSEPMSRQLYPYVFWSGAAHVETHVPPTQYGVAAGQTCPQPPQLVVSTEIVVQPLHHVWPSPHGGR